MVMVRNGGDSSADGDLRHVLLHRPLDLSRIQVECGRMRMAEDWGIEPFAVETIVAVYKIAARTF